MHRWIDAPPDAPCCTFQDATATYGDLWRHVAALHAAWGPDRVPERAVACQGRFYTTVALLTAWHRGEVVRLPPNHTPQVLAALAAEVPLVHDGAHDVGQAIQALVADLPDDAAPTQAPAGEQVLVALATSGSTGHAQWHGKTARQVLGEATAQGEAFPIAPGTHVLATIPAHHIYGLLFSVLVPLLHGAVFHDTSPLFEEAVIAHLATHGTRVLVSVPAHLRALAAASEGYDGLTRVFSSGAPLHAETAQAWHQVHGIAITEVFGSTETGGIAWRHRVQREAWTPLPGVRIDADEDGRLLLDSPFLPPEAPRPHPCDDQVRLHDDGTFTHQGRLDDVVKIASKRVSVGGVTAQLLAIDGVHDAAVLAHRPPGGRTRLHAFVVAPGVSPTTLRIALAEVLDAVAIPRIHPVEALPRTATGKLPRSHLEALLPRANSISHTVTIAVDDDAFDGHFPEQPILPGVVTLHRLVVGPAQAAWPTLGPLRTLKRVKLRAPIRPGDQVTVSLTRESPDRVAAQITRGDATCLTAKLHFGETPA